jgi:hypothetical protein
MRSGAIQLYRSEERRFEKKMHKNIPKTYGLCCKGLLQKFLGCYQLLYQQLG